MNRRARSAPSRSLVVQAYNDIKDGILTSRLAPGQLVNGPELAETYGMSRTPVREALALLAKEGFVTAVPRVGYLISSPSVEDVKEIFELRFQLEGFAAAAAATRVSQAELDLFDQVDYEVRELAKSLAPDDPKTVRLAIESNRRFHLLVADAAHNHRLAQMIDRLLEEGERIEALDPHFRSVGFLAGAHLHIIDALRLRDPYAARQAMEDHVRDTQERIFRSTLSPPAGS